MFAWKKVPYLCFTICSLNLHAKEQEQLFESPRAWGRGGAYVAADDSDEATRMNPSTLAQDKFFQIRPLQMDAFVGENTVETVSDLMTLVSSNDGLGFLKKFDDKFGKKQYLRGQLSPLSVRKGSFETSPILANQSWIILKNPSVPEFQWSSDTLAGVNFSYGFLLPISAIPGLLQMGVTIRPSYRLYIAGGIDFIDILDFIPPSQTKFEDFSPLRTGSGVGGDMGFTWSPIANGPLRLGLTIQNIGHMGYLSSSEIAPPLLKQNINMGLLYRKALGTWDLDYYADLLNIENRDHLNALRLFHTGFELGRSVFTRDHDYGITLGLNEGYFTGGIFFDIYILRFDISNYAVESGAVSGQSLDRRWAISMKSSLTF